MPAHLYLDIETLPDLAMDTAARRALAESKVPGGYSKPDTIARWIEEHADDEWRRTALDSMRGEVLCIGFAVDDAAPQVAYRDGTEADLLARFDAALTAANAGRDLPLVVAHNGARFDFPWLWRRAVRYNLPLLARVLPREPYDKRLRDTMLMWAGTDRSFSGATLDGIARYLGMPGKADGIDGSQVLDFYLSGRHTEIADYCAQDVRVLRAIYQRMTFAAE